MSTLSFQDYVRERMLRRRRAEIAGDAGAASASHATAAQISPPAPPAAPAVSFTPVAEAVEASSRFAAAAVQGLADPKATAPQEAPARRGLAPTQNSGVGLLRRPADSRTEPTPDDPEGLGAFAEKIETMPALSAGDALALQREQGEMLQELREVRSLIEQRFGALAFMEKMQREPRAAQLAQRLLDAGFSPSLIRRLTDSLPPVVDELSWAASVIERNLQTSERDPALEDSGGVFALIGATGVGKTTGTAKLAAAFATRHGASNLGLITLDAYRVAAHEQLRAYGRILGVPVHTAHDRASLEDLLDLLGGKKLVLIDTAGMAQRDERTRDLLDMLGHRSVQRILVVNAAAQGETIDDVISAYRAAQCRGVVLSKLDEAVKLGPVLDAMIRNKLKVLAVANGQRVPEDWHRLSASTLVQRALRTTGQSAWKRDTEEVNLVFAGAALPSGDSLAS
jgi:flagellar biosynthesis protein FlhF